MQSEVHSFVEGLNVPDVTFLFGGYDWCQSCFRIWRISFDLERNEFISLERKNSNKFGGLGKVEVAGDLEWVRAVRKNVKNFAQHRFGRDMRQPATARFDMEPFEAVRELLRNAEATSSVGGAPQVMKVYRYMNCVDVGVFWPDIKEGRLFVSGRPLLEYERGIIHSVLDPDSVNSTWASGNTEEARDRIKVAIDKEGERRLKNRGGLE